MQITSRSTAYATQPTSLRLERRATPARMAVRFGEETPKPKSLLDRIRTWAFGLAMFSAGVAGTRTYDYATTPNPHRVTHIVDGDTFDMANGERARIYGIDAPEEGQPFYEESRDNLARLVEGRVVEVKQKGKSFDRKVFQVFIHGQDVGETMVKQGEAFAEEKYAHGVYKDAEKEASKKKQGVWSQPGGGVRPWDFRKQKKS